MDTPSALHFVAAYSAQPLATEEWRGPHVTFEPRGRDQAGVARFRVLQDELAAPFFRGDRELPAGLRPSAAEYRVRFEAVFEPELAVVAKAAAADWARFVGL